MVRKSILIAVCALLMMQTLGGCKSSNNKAPDKDSLNNNQSVKNSDSKGEITFLLNRQDIAKNVLPKYVDEFKKTNPNGN
jgi:hypothetical protein